jgi:hypothetical protein
MEGPWSRFVLTLLGFIDIMCQLFWWVPLVSGIGLLFRQEWKSAIIALCVTVLMIGLWKGIEELFGYLQSHGVDF